MKYGRRWRKRMRRYQAEEADGDAKNLQAKEVLGRLRLEDVHFDEAELSARANEIKTKILDVLKSLTFREREILKLRFGLDDGYTYTLEEVGRKFRITRERVRYIESRALRKLQHPVRSNRLINLLEHLEEP